MNEGFLNQIKRLIKMHEAILQLASEKVNEAGETDPQTQAKIDKSIKELEGLYELREMFS